MWKRPRAALERILRSERKLLPGTLSRVAVACLILNACTPQQSYYVSATGVRSTTPPPEETDEYVGTTRWATSKTTICDDPDALHSERKCFTHTGAFDVKRKVRYGQYSLSSAYDVQLKDGRQGFIDMLFLTDDEKEHSRKIAAKADCDKRGGVRVGMTRDQVYASCWGKPTSVNKTIGTYGTHEQLIYGSRNYLYLENGILSSIQTSQ